MDDCRLEFRKPLSEQPGIYMPHQRQIENRMIDNLSNAGEYSAWIEARRTNQSHWNRLIGQTNQ